MSTTAGCSRRMVNYILSYYNRTYIVSLQRSKMSPTSLYTQLIVGAVLGGFPGHHSKVWPPCGPK